MASVWLLLSATTTTAVGAQDQKLADLPAALHDRVVCSVAAAVKYQVPANLVLAVAEQEGGRVGQWSKNHNGTYDIGPLQFNTRYLSSLARFGITTADVEAAGCYPYDLATWRLRQHLAEDTGDLWTRAANYHSRTPALNAKYRKQLLRRAIRWAAFLSSHFRTAEWSTHLEAPMLPPVAASLRATTAAHPTSRHAAPRAAPASARAASPAEPTSTTVSLTEVQTAARSALANVAELMATNSREQ
jgi:hypothetical protein